MVGVTELPKDLKKSKFKFEWGTRLIHKNGMFRLVQPFDTLKADKKYVACYSLGLMRSGLSPKHLNVVMATELIPADQFPEPIDLGIDYILDTREYNPDNLEIVYKKCTDYVDSLKG